MNEEIKKIEEELKAEEARALGVYNLYLENKSQKLATEMAFYIDGVRFAMTKLNYIARNSDKENVEETNI